MRKPHDLFEYYVDWMSEPLVEIVCTKCGVEDHYIDHECEHELWRDGWRVTRNNCYCSRCAKKYLKNK